MIGSARSSKSVVAALQFLVLTLFHEKLNWRRFRLRGVARVQQEALPACLTYNIQLWMRLHWCPRRLAAGPAATG